MFLVPAAGRPTDGAYLRYPVARFCAAIAAASIEKRAVIVGEDLGTVPEGLQELLASCGLLTYRLFIFARDAEVRFLPPEAYPRDALVAITTHDLPTFAGFWTMRDIALRSELSLYPEPSLAQVAHDERQRAKDAIMVAIRASGFAAGDDLPSIAIAIHRFLARTPSAIFFVQMEDVAFEADQANVPGTIDTYPNWRRKLARDIEEIFRDPRSLALFEAIRAERPRSNQPP